MTYRISQHPIFRKTLYAAVVLGAAILTGNAINAEAGSDASAETNYATLWSNGTPKENGTMVDGLRNGVWTSWYPNGQKSELGQYHEGRRIGIWTFWDEDGSFNRIERYPTPSLIDELGLDEEFLYFNGEAAEWKTLALAAGYMFQYSRGLQEQDDMLYKEALLRVNRSIELEEHYWNARLKVFILQKINQKEMQQAARRAIEIGQREKKNFASSNDFRVLSELVAQDGC